MGTGRGARSAMAGRAELYRRRGCSGVRVVLELTKALPGPMSKKGLISSPTAALDMARTAVVRATVLNNMMGSWDAGLL